MILYHYVPLKNTVLQDGLLSVSRLPSELQKYAERAHAERSDQIQTWLNLTFPARDRSISVLTEPVHWQGCDPMLKVWTDAHLLVEIDFDALERDGLIESIWCKVKSEKNGKHEIFQRITADKIDITPLSWERCSQEKGLFFGAVRHYFLTLKNGEIPPCYLKMKGA